MTFEDFINRILSNLKVEVADEFDRNFERKAFFGDAWQPTKYPNHLGSLMLRSGDLRKSILAELSKGQIKFSSSLPYASVHNEGGTLTISVTPQSRKFFWAKFKETGDSRWKAMALTKKTTFSIPIPKRQFIGHHPAIDTAAKQIFDSNFQDFIKAFNKDLGI